MVIHDFFEIVCSKCLTLLQQGIDNYIENSTQISCSPKLKFHIFLENIYIYHFITNSTFLTK